MRQLCMPMPTIMDASDAVSTEMPCGNFIQDRGRERGKEKGRGGHRPSALLGRLVTNICPSHTYNFLACLLLHCIVTSFLLWCIKDSQLVVSQNIQDLAKESQPPEPLCMTRVVKFCHMFTSLKNSAGEGGREGKRGILYIAHPGLYGPNPFSHCHPPFCGRSLGSFSVQIGLYTGDSRDSIRWVINLWSNVNVAISVTAKQMTSIVYCKISPWYIVMRRNPAISDSDSHISCYFNSLLHNRH